MEIIITSAFGTSLATTEILHPVLFLHFKKDVETLGRGSEKSQKNN